MFHHCELLPKRCLGNHILLVDIQVLVELKVDMGYGRCILRDLSTPKYVSRYDLWGC